MADWLLYEHEDGRHAVAPSAEAATFAHDEPAWHRVGPVHVVPPEHLPRPVVADAARVLAEFAKTAPGRLPQRVHDAIAVATSGETPSLWDLIPPSAAEWFADCPGIANEDWRGGWDACLNRIHILVGKSTRGVLASDGGQPE